jgi:ribonucleoside-diphosphate reductase alpha chain
METGCGNLYVTVNKDSGGLCEIFSTIGKAGGCASAQSEAISRLISLAMRSGVEVQSVIKQLKGIRCALPVWKDGELILSCPDALAKVLEHRVIETGGSPVATEDKLKEEDVEGKPRPALAIPPQLPDARILEVKLAGTCPDCGFHLDHEEGCMVCHACGFSRCG